MSVNLELKSECASPAFARAVAAQLGAVPAGTLIQEDTYFNVPRGRLKLRELERAPAELIYYERVEDTLERWSRYDREVVGEPAGVKTILARALGVRVIVRKRRDLWLFRDARIHIDEVEGLGSFVEFEVTGGETPATVETMRDLRAAFDIRDESVIKVSYSDMILAKRDPEKKNFG